uniref:Uncharacterized protein AlNc14C245G9540 n=1 Tax=Albugo laibachii Nc14 TaxID=890382 RepID=F0WT56_9STRA|nr:conserved hypothetical protein [Albugo laibachii Nc14]CCA25968.1 conserved hypothetical protein [Albugo laibachii Nc14]|eukprot:CCA25968.1 conserved hypothetical protein [Albugo laibachii Nc14]
MLLPLDHRLQFTLKKSMRFYPFSALLPFFSQIQYHNDVQTKGAFGMTDDKVERIVHACGVYLYLIDKGTNTYVQQTNSVVGCVLLSNETSTFYRLLFYDTKKKSLLNISLPSGGSWLQIHPQPDNCARIDHNPSKEPGCTLRFRSTSELEAFLTVVVCAQAQLALIRLRDENTKAAENLVQVQILTPSPGMKEICLGNNDLAGIHISTWKNDMNVLPFSVDDPIKLLLDRDKSRFIQQDKRKIYLGDMRNDSVTAAIAKGITGMQRHESRYVVILLPLNEQWIIAHIELLKIKKAHGKVIDAADTTRSSEQSQGNSSEGLISRMESLSRAGSQGFSKYVAVPSSRAVDNDKDTTELRESIDSLDSFQSRRHSTIVDALAAPGQAIPLVGLHQSNEAGIEKDTIEKPSSLVNNVAHNVEQPQVLDSENFTNTFVGGNSGTTSKDYSLDDLLKEQEKLNFLRKELDKQRQGITEFCNVSPESQNERPNMKMKNMKGEGSESSSLVLASSASDSYHMEEKYNKHKVPTSSPVGPLYTKDINSGLTHGVQNSFFPNLPWQHSPPSILPSLLRTPTFLPHNNTNFTISNHEMSNLSLESNFLKLQRTSTAIENSVRDLHTKVDRLNNASLLRSTASSVHFSSNLGSSSNFMASGLDFSNYTTNGSSSALMLKNIERALTQKDELQQALMNLTKANESSRFTIEDLTNKVDALQRENHRLIERNSETSLSYQEEHHLEVREVKLRLEKDQDELKNMRLENQQLRQTILHRDNEVQTLRRKMDLTVQQQVESMRISLHEQVASSSEGNTRKLQSEKMKLEQASQEAREQLDTYIEHNEKLMIDLDQLKAQNEQLEDKIRAGQHDHSAQIAELEATHQHFRDRERGYIEEIHSLKNSLAQVETSLCEKQRIIKKLNLEQIQQDVEAISGWVKESMNEIYFYFQDAFDEENEFNGKEIVTAIRQVLKQRTLDILSKLEAHLLRKTGRD